MGLELLRIGLPQWNHRRRGLLPSEVKIAPDRIKAMWERPQKGAIGCHFSQVAVMKEALRMDKHAVVMEDDLEFCDDFLDRLAIIDEFTARYEWDIFWLGGTFHVNPPYWHKASHPERGCQTLGRDAMRTPAHLKFPRIVRTFGCFCTYAYIVNRESIKKVLDRMEARLPESIGIDHMMIMLQPDLFAYAFVPGSVKQYDHTSDIGVDGRGGPGFTKFSTFETLNKICKCPNPDKCAHAAENLRRSAYWFQKKMENFDPEGINWNEAGR